MKAESEWVRGSEGKKGVKEERESKNNKGRVKGRIRLQNEGRWKVNEGK